MKLNEYTRLTDTDIMYAHPNNSPKKDKPRLKKAIIKRIIKLRKEKMIYQKIADALHLPLMTVWNAHLKYQGDKKF